MYYKICIVYAPFYCSTREHKKIFVSWYHSHVLALWLACLFIVWTPAYVFGEPEWASVGCGEVGSSSSPWSPHSQTTADSRPVKMNYWQRVMESLWRIVKQWGWRGMGISHTSGSGSRPGTLDHWQPQRSRGTSPSTPHPSHPVRK